MATTSTGQNTHNIEHHHYHYHNYYSTKVANLTKLINVELDLLKESFEEAKRRINPVIAQINEARDKFEEILQQGEGGEMMMELEMERVLRDLKQTTSKLKSKIPFNLIAPVDQPSADPIVILQPQSHHHKPNSSINDELVDNHRPSIPQNLFPYFYDDSYDPNYRSPILRCFLAFPEGAFIKASLMCSYVNATLFALLDRRLTSLEDTVWTASELVSEGFIKSVYKKHSCKTLDGFWMDPLVHRTLKDHLSSEDHFKGSSPELRSIVVSRINGEDIFYGGSADPSYLPSHLAVLHLGKWQKSPTHNIEMPDPNLYFKHIGPLLNPKYISFRGVSAMKELPDFITRVRNLLILDLKACHHLEVLPSDIGNLWRRLTHLDMSECYFLDYMPASLSRLINLRVLKGFFVGETINNEEEECCTLQDLSSLRLLMKLNIHTSLKTFPSEDHLTILQGFIHLRNLTICWGGCPSRIENPQLRPKKLPTFRLKSLATRYPDPFAEVNELSFKLEKLDLRGAPENASPNWLRPSNFKKLEKLYIRGGQLTDLRHNDQVQNGKQIADLKENEWSVKILRLRHLSKLKMDWSELQISFPNVVSAEKVDCPNLTSFPCDDSGLWTKDTTQPSASTSS